MSPWTMVLIVGLVLVLIWLAGEDIP